MVAWLGGGEENSSHSRIGLRIRIFFSNIYLATYESNFL